MINPVVLQRSFIAWMKDCHVLTDGEVIAIDGKTLRGSYNRSKGKGTIHMVNVFAIANGMSIGQQKVDSKSNEITAILKPLDLLDVKMCLSLLKSETTFKGGIKRKRMSCVMDEHYLSKVLVSLT